MCCGVMTIAGCAQSETPRAVDLASVRCPGVALGDARVLARRPVVPEGAVTVAGARKWIDDLTLQVEAKGRAGARVIRQYNRCRSGLRKAGGNRDGSS